MHHVWCFLFCSWLHSGFNSLTGRFDWWHARAKSPLNGRRFKVSPSPPHTSPLQRSPLVPFSRSFLTFSLTFCSFEESRDLIFMECQPISSHWANRSHLTLTSAAMVNTRPWHLAEGRSDLIRPWCNARAARSPTKVRYDSSSSTTGKSALWYAVSLSLLFIHGN